MPIVVKKVVIESVADASGLARAISDGDFAADHVIAVIGKTEGNGGVNDFTRLLSDRAFREILLQHGSRALEEIKQIPMVWSGGTDGVICPHATIFARTPDTGAPDTGDPRLAVGIAISDVILPEDIGRPTMVEKVAQGVRRAMADAAIADAQDVHYVQTKTPLLTVETINDAKSRGHRVFTQDTMDSMNISNGTTALGIGVALGEIPMPAADQIAHDLSLFSARASCSSGVELDRAQIVLVGNRPGAGGRFRIGHAFMQDALDIDGIYAAIRNAGLDLPERPRAEDLQGRLVNVFMKCEADPTARLRGRRQVALDDSDVHHTHHMKAAVGAVAATAIGDPAVFVSVAALHQGPSGGGPVAAIVDLG